MALVDQHLLSWLIVCPLLGAAFCMTFPAGGASGVRATALVACAAELGLGVRALVRFQPQELGWQLAEQVPWLPQLGISWRLGVDGLALSLVGLTVVLAPLVVLSTWGGSAGRAREQVSCLLLLVGCMVGTLLAVDLLLFYVFFEAMLLPALFWVQLCGGPRRQQAANGFVLYTLLGSLLMLVALLCTVRAAANYGPVTFCLDEVAARLRGHSFGPSEIYLFCGLALAFVIKAAWFPWHGWLPGLYEAAPAGAAALFGGVMGKIGLFGLLRYGFGLFPAAAAQAAPLLATLAVVGVVYGACLAVAQDSLRGWLAYSSLSHMGLMGLGICAMTPISLVGVGVQMVHHGLCTAGLFLMAGVLGHRRGLRGLSEGGGLAGTMPRLTLLFAIVAISFMGLPGLGGFVGELLITLGSFASQNAATSLTGGQLAMGALWALQGAALIGWACLAVRLLGRRRRRPRWQAAGLLAAGLGLLGALLGLPGAMPRGGLWTAWWVAAAANPSPFLDWAPCLTVVALAGTILSAVYTLMVLRRLFFGPPRPRAADAGIGVQVDLGGREMAMLWPVVLLSLWLGLQPQGLLSRLAPPAARAAHSFRAAAGLPVQLGAGS